MHLRKGLYSNDDLTVDQKKKKKEKGKICVFLFKKLPQVNSTYDSLKNF